MQIPAGSIKKFEALLCFCLWAIFFLLNVKKFIFWHKAQHNHEFKENLTLSYLVCSKSVNFLLHKILQYYKMFEETFFRLLVPVCIALCIEYCRFHILYSSYPIEKREIPALTRDLIFYICRSKDTKKTSENLNIL